jgi:hypothetical protein
VTANSGASTSSVPDTTNSPPLVEDVNYTSVNASVGIEDHFPVSDLLDAVGGSHTDSGASTSSATHITYPPSVPDENHMSVDALTGVEDCFNVPDLSETAGVSHI